MKGSQVVEHSGKQVAPEALTRQAEASRGAPEGQVDNLHHFLSLGRVAQQPQGEAEAELAVTVVEGYQHLAAQGGSFTIMSRLLLAQELDKFFIARAASGGSSTSLRGASGSREGAAGWFWGKVW